MIPVIKYYWLQLLHYWQNFRFRLKIEIFLLLLIVFTFFTSHADKLFSTLLQQSGPSSFGLISLISHVLLILLILPTPFIFYNLLPKQPGLKLVSVQPLKDFSALMVIVIHVMKYQLITLLLILPILIALSISIANFTIIYAFIILPLWLVFSIVFTHFLITIELSKVTVYSFYYLFFLFYFILAGLTYWFTELFISYSIATLTAGILASTYWWKRSWKNWDLVLNRLRPQLKKSRHQLSGWTYFNFPAILPSALLIHVKRDILSYLRNKNYRRLKFFGLAAFLLLVIIIQIFYSNHYQILLPVLSILFIWTHYAQQFNEKYVVADKKVFIKIQPITFGHVALARFISELLYILLILLMLVISLIIENIPWTEAITIMSVISLFAIFVLYTITVIRLLFYDRPRFAGYAYHFMIIFTLLMSYNFYLVGPMITLIILIYMNMLSYRQFVR